MNIDIVDNFLDSPSYEKIIEFCQMTETYRYGETDRFDTPPVGMISEIYDVEIIRILEDSIAEKFEKKTNGRPLNRSYVNCFSSGDKPYFHIDSESKDDLTFLFYVNQFDWEPDMGGETQFFDGERIIGIPPISNRMVCFEANILHRATALRNGYRFTIALKY